MKNVDITVKGNIATIKIDLSQDFGKSKSGLTTIVASTGGNQKIEGTEVILGLNAYKK